MTEEQTEDSHDQDELVTGKNAQGFPEEGCPYCGSDKLYRNGFRENDGFQEWICRECDEKFLYRFLADLFVAPDGTKIEDGGESPRPHRNDTAMTDDTTNFECKDCDKTVEKEDAQAYGNENDYLYRCPNCASELA